jgi:hypothetical protein
MKSILYLNLFIHRNTVFISCWNSFLFFSHSNRRTGILTIRGKNDCVVVTEFMFSKSSLGVYLVYCPMLDCVLTGSSSQMSSDVKDSFSRRGVKDFAYLTAVCVITQRRWSFHKVHIHYLIAGRFYFSLRFVKGVPGLLHTPLREIFHTSLYVGKILASAIRC